MGKRDLYKLIDETNKRRFINYNCYNIDKMGNDRFVSDTIYMLSMEFRRYFSSNEKRFREQETIKIVDIGPAHGAIGTCFFLMIINEFNLLDKVQLCLIDPVEEVINDNRNINFPLKETIELIYKKLYGKELDSDELNKLFHLFKNLFNNAIGVKEKIQCFKAGKKNETYDVSICTFSLHHIHPDHKSKALKVVIDLLKPKGFFAFADEWFGENYYEQFLLGRNHIQDPIPFEFPESPEDLIQRLKQKISLIKIIYDEKEAFMLSGHKRIFEDKRKTGHYPDIDYFNIDI